MRPDDQGWAGRLLHHVRPGSVGGRLARGAFWSTLGALVARALAVISGIVLARILGRTGLGQFGVVQSTVGMFETVGSFGMQGTAAKYVAGLRSSDPLAAARIRRLAGRVALLTGLLCAGAMWLAAPWLAGRALADASLGGLLRVAAVALFFMALDGAQSGVLTGLERFRDLAVVNVLHGVAYLAVMLCAVYLGGLPGAVAGMVICYLIRLFLNTVTLRRQWRVAGLPHADRLTSAEWRILWQFSVPSVLNGLLVAPVSWLANAMLVNAPGGYDQMGLLSVASPWMLLVTFVPIQAAGAALPVFSELAGRSDPSALRRTFGVKTAILAAMAIAIAIPAAVLAPWILRLYGPAFETAHPVFLASLLCGVVVCGIAPSGITITALGRMWPGFLLNLLWCGLFLLGCRLLIPTWGATGQVWARTAAYLVQWVVSLCLIAAWLGVRRGRR